jgi:lipoprotein LpqB-like beta-propeller protein/sporulation and spore germination protein
MRQPRASYSVRAVAAAAFAATLLLAGCASIPTSGSVHSAEQAAGSDSSTQPQQDIQFYPEPPADSASAEQIVRGFLDASGAVEPAVGNQPDFATARKYLASDDPKDWRPGNEIKIYDGPPTLTLDGADRVEFEADVTGTIDDRGTYHPATAGTAYQHPFDLQEVRGQRRIANPPQLLLISKSNFDREYESLNLYFFDPSSKFLVPDPVYLAKRADRATLLVRDLLNGPSLWLSPAVRSAFPPGTALADRGVRVVGGQAIVDLTGNIATASRSQLDALAAQLVRTLAQLQISSVTVTAGGKATAVTNLDVDSVVTQPPEPTAYGLRDNLLYTFQSIGADEVRPVKMTGPFAKIRLSEFAVQPGSGSGSATIAGVDETRTKLYIAQGALPAKQITQGARQWWSPTWDHSGRLWVVDKHGGRGRIVVIDSREQAHPVEAPQLVGGSLSVEAIAVSEDGTRLALITTDAQGHRDAKIAAITTVGGATELHDLRSLAPGLSKTRDIAWRGPAELVILGTQLNGQLQPYLVGVDGSQLAAQGTVENPQSVTAAQNKPILVGTGSRELWQQSGGGTWERVDQNMATPHYPG